MPSLILGRGLSVPSTAVRRLQWNFAGVQVHGTKIFSDSRFCLFVFSFAHFYFLASGQAVWSQVSSLPPPRLLPTIFTAHKVQRSHCSSSFHRVLLTHALVLSASQFVHKKKSPRIYTSMHSGGFELAKRTHTRLEDNLIRHRGDRQLGPVL